MLKILIAEDQVLIQKDICIKVEKTGKEVVIAGTALNGEDAYRQIVENQPDILITDIRMPMLSGLELIRRLKENDFYVKTVILSGYKDFEYAKEAIQLGVDEYLLKPVSVDDLKYVLDTLEEKIVSEQNYTCQNAFSMLLNTDTPLPASVQKSLHFDRCHLMLINMNSCATFSFQDWLPFENELEELLKGPLVHKYLKRDENVFLCNGSTYNQKYMFLLLNRTNEEKLNMMARELIRGIERLTTSVTICISRPAQKVNSLNLEYKLMKNQLEDRLIFSRSSVLHVMDFLANMNISGISLEQSLLESFRFSVKAQNLESLLTHLDKFIDKCEKENATQKYLSICLKRLLHTCFGSTGEYKLAGKELEIDEYLSNSKTYPELELSLHMLFEQLFNRHILKQNTASNPEEFIEEIKEYIRTNYSRDININDIAVHFSITPAYMSRLFKKCSDVRPIEYLTSYRIQQSCYYFAHSQLTVREVAELCGYSNQFYFSKAFKQITGISPSEYRIQHQTDMLL